MAFKETPAFPDRIAFGAVGGPAFSTGVVRVTGGNERRNENWLTSRQEYEVSQAVKSEADHREIAAFFRTVGGRRDGFRFKDYIDFAALITEGAVDGIDTTHFQLVKVYTSGSDTQRRAIRKPIAAGFVLKNSGTPLVLTTDYTLDATTGIVTTVVPRTAGNLTWSGEFDVPVRFDTDRLQGQIVNRNATDGFIVSWESIPLVEIMDDADL